MRNIARIIVVAIKRNPRALAALRQHQLIQKRSNLIYKLSYNTLCIECRFMLEDSRMCHSCDRYVCASCAPHSSICEKGCCALILHSTCRDIRRCYKLDCGRVCGRPTQCVQCKAFMCDNHRCYCPYCANKICEPCVLEGHHGCEKKENF